VTEEGVTDLLLAGYVSLRTQGLALPCYASGHRSNAWYCARCSIDGDHAGIITAFDPFQSDEIVLLPTEAARSVAVGDAWHDVLLWKGEQYVGTPSIIIAQLGKAVAQLASEAPLTLLDLAMASDELDRLALTKTAFAHVQRNWGEEEASHWRSDTFARRQLIIEVRRLLSAANAPDPDALARGLEINLIGAELEIEISPLLRRHLKYHRLMDLFAERAQTFALETGVPLLAIAEDAPAVGPSKIPAVPSQGTSPEVSPLIQDGARGVLVVASGSRARMLQHNLRRPEWIPDWDVDSTAVTRSAPLSWDGGAPAAVDIMDPQSTLPDMRSYSTVIWVVDDDSFVGEGSHFAHAQLMGAFGLEQKPLCIVAPLLPTQFPAKLLADPSLLDNFPLFDTILDTSFVRSPFWSGNTRRSIDRRVADLISNTAQLLSGRSPLRTWMMEDQPSYQRRLLTIATGIPGGEADLVSEISSTRMPQTRGHGRPKRFTWREVPSSGGYGQMLLGAALVRQHNPEFGDFAAAVVKHKVSSSGYHQLRIGATPASITEALRYPTLCAAVNAMSSSHDELCVVTAEAPGLPALRAAERVGWSVMRYSDTEALAHFWSTGRRTTRQLPADIVLPALNRLGRNRGLAVRGVDPRDIIRVPAEVVEEWQISGSSDVLRDFRWYRSSIGNQETLRLTDVAAIPALRLLDADFDQDVALDLLRRYQRVGPLPADFRSKRASDLRASWSSPAEGTSRYMLEDGALPARFGSINSDEIAAQKFFTIDGDASVPVLLSSRLFQVWARATVTRSPSWASRFSITRTFETFPLPDLFVIVGDGANDRTSLRANPASEMSSLLRGLGQGEIGWREMENGRDASDLLKRSEELLWRSIGLTEDASDLDLLERMVEMNRHFGAD